jgi:hypothetical protein
VEGERTGFLFAYPAVAAPRRKRHMADVTDGARNKADPKPFLAGNMTLLS